MGLTPTQSPVEITALMKGSPPLGDDCEPNSIARISPTRSPKFASTNDGITPLGDNRANSPRHMYPTDHTVDRDQRSGEA